MAARIAAAGGPPCRIVVIRTSGDRLQDAPLSEVGGKRLFVKEIEDALLRDEIDLAVHSSKDMPAVLPDGLVIAGVLPREDPRDAVVFPVRLKPDTTARAMSAVHQPSAGAVATIDDLVAALGQSPSIGTGSVRRIAQLTRLFPGARFTPIRGNLDTRLRKLDEGAHDALVLAAAGLRRLGFANRISFALPAAACVPAPGQGIVAVEIRAGRRARAGVRVAPRRSGGRRRARRRACAGRSARRRLPDAGRGAGHARSTTTRSSWWPRSSRSTAAGGARARASDRGRKPRRSARESAPRSLAQGADEILADARQRRRRSRQSQVRSHDGRLRTGD